jgi:DNA-binding XRE family transcriptional regulator
MINPHPYPNFAQALRAYGETSVEIARALGVSQRSAYNYMTGKYLPTVQLVKRKPDLDEALTKDFAQNT